MQIIQTVYQYALTLTGLPWLMLAVAIALGTLHLCVMAWCEAETVIRGGKWGKAVKRYRGVNKYV